MHFRFVVLVYDEPVQHGSHDVQVSSAPDRWWALEVVEAPDRLRGGGLTGSDCCVLDTVLTLQRK